jgi:transposase-like protein
MIMALSDLQQQAVQLIVLDRWNPSMANDKVAKTLDVNKSTVFRWRKDAEFDKALKKEIERDRSNFDDVPLAFRKNRVLALEDLYNKIEDRRVALKLKVLKEIREEVGDHRIQVEHTVEVKGLNVPPRADSYDEWLKQNSKMDKAVETTYTVEDSDGT